MDFLNHETAFRGDDFSDKVKGAASILVCGCGTLGSNLVVNLVCHGFTNIDLLDMDRVENHNIGPQAYDLTHVGMMKVAALENIMYNICDHVLPKKINKKLDEKNVRKLTKSYGLVVDCFDNKDARKALAENCQSELIHAGLIGGYGEVFWNKDYKVPEDSTNPDEDICDYPMARNIAMLAVTILSEEVIDYLTSDSPRQKNWCVTLNDLKIKEC